MLHHNTHASYCPNNGNNLETGVRTMKTFMLLLTFYADDYVEVHALDVGLTGGDCIERLLTEEPYARDIAATLSCEVDYGDTWE